MSPPSGGSPRRSTPGPATSRLTRTRRACSSPRPRATPRSRPSTTKCRRRSARPWVRSSPASRGAERIAGADPQDLEMAAEVIRAGLTGLAVWWIDHPEVPRERIVATAVNAVWIGLERLQRGEAWRPDPGGPSRVDARILERSQPLRVARGGGLRLLRRRPQSRGDHPAMARVPRHDAGRDRDAGRDPDRLPAEAARHPRPLAHANRGLGPAAPLRGCPDPRPVLALGAHPQLRARRPRRRDHRRPRPLRAAPRPARRPRPHGVRAQGTSSGSSTTAARRCGSGWRRGDRAPRSRSTEPSTVVVPGLSHLGPRPR